MILEHRFVPSFKYKLSHQAMVVIFPNLYVNRSMHPNHYDETHLPHVCYLVTLNDSYSLLADKIRRLSLEEGQQPYV